MRRATAHGVGSIPAAGDANFQWTRELSDTMRPFTTRTDDVNQPCFENR
jgi:hypothetical protein